MILETTSDSFRLSTSSAADLDVMVYFVEAAVGGTPPLSPTDAKAQGTKFTSATVQEILAAPGSGLRRTVTLLTARNKHASLSNDATIIHRRSGPTDYELHLASLKAGELLEFVPDMGFFVVERPLILGRAYEGKVISPYGSGDPNALMRELQNAGHVNATPTNITTSIARCAAFRPRKNITVNTIRYYGIGATTSIYRVALYRYSDLARLTSELAFTTAANTWGAISVSPAVTLSAGELYFIAVAVNATGTTAGVACIGTTTSATVGQIQSAPGALPGNLDLDLGFFEGFLFQFAVTSGALPNPAATLVQPAVWTGGIPAFWLDAA